jgi:hypothetical protein
MKEEKKNFEIINPFPHRKFCVEQWYSGFERILHFSAV